jgi:hypothetical protein
MQFDVDVSDRCIRDLQPRHRRGYVTKGGYHRASRWSASQLAPRHLTNMFSWASNRAHRGIPSPETSSLMIMRSSGSGSVRCAARGDKSRQLFHETSTLRPMHLLALEKEKKAALFVLTSGLNPYFPQGFHELTCHVHIHLLWRILTRSRKSFYRIIRLNNFLQLSSLKWLANTHPYPLLRVFLAVCLFAFYKRRSHRTSETETVTSEM